MDRPPVGEVQDLATLAKLDESILLEEISARYCQDKIYTYVGDILIAVNPFKDIGIYGKHHSAQYHNTKRSTLAPHIFAVADAVYQALQGHGGRSPGNQCILISGESGAGKTESTKLIIKQLVDLCRGNTQLEQQILQVNPLLEAFGNAQTNLNDNSSRFGKYIQLRFHHRQLVGAKISEYLLEKSRVVRQNAGENNFHIFYYVFASETSRKLGLGQPTSYRYITHEKQNTLRERQHTSGPWKHLSQKFEQLVNSMDLVGFTDEEQENMFAVIASVLHLGNIVFNVSDSDDSISITETDGTVAKAAELLGVDAAEIVGCLTCMVTVTKGDHVRRNYSRDQAEDARDAMAKTIYGRLFGWIVYKINGLLVHSVREHTLAMSEIGILDIFGFEDFAKDGGKNSFEQACINLANEQLQFFFNQHIFKMEQEEYQKEGIDWNVIKFVDNKPLLDMFVAKPMGILALLDEESLFPKGTDLSYVEKLTKAFAGKEYFLKSQQTNKAVFAIEHYAGKVSYTVDKWLEKNRDTLPPGLTQLLQSSSNVLIKTIFRGQITRTGSLIPEGNRSQVTKHKAKIQKPAVTNQDAAQRKLTVGAQFKNSLNVLMERMTSSSPVFVRCLKPNYLKKPGYLDTQYVLAQLLYTGMLETVEIRRKGFAVRPTFAHFVDKYKILVDWKMQGTANNCNIILKSANLHGWCLGKSKVFLKHEHIEQLTDMLETRNNSALHIQKVFKGFLGRREFVRRKEEAGKEKEKLESMLQQAMRLSSESTVRLTDLSARCTSHDASHDMTRPASVAPKSGDGWLKSDTGTQMDDQAHNEKKLSEVKQAAMTWFKETQTYNVMTPDRNKFSDWFHGIISRMESERLLKDKIIGCFLIRVSESRFGYTLSFKAESRCRHYMIDQLKNGKFIVVGEPKVHRSLHAMIDYHKKVKISNWDHFLTVPCGQDHGECDYTDLIADITKDNMKFHTPSSNVKLKYSESPKSSKRPLPKLPEEVYNKMMDEKVDGR